MRFAVRSVRTFRSRGVRPQHRQMAQRGPTLFAPLVSSLRPGSSTGRGTCGICSLRPVCWQFRASLRHKAFVVCRPRPQRHQASIIPPSHCRRRPRRRPLHTHQHPVEPQAMLRRGQPPRPRPSRLRRRQLNDRRSPSGPRQCSSISPARGPVSRSSDSFAVCGRWSPEQERSSCCCLSRPTVRPRSLA